MRKNFMASDHSVMRAKERMGLNKNAAKTVIANARERGLCADDFEGRERLYLANKEDGFKYVRVYQGMYFVFAYGGTCITVVNLPGWFGKKNYYYKKESIRNPKKYLEHYAGLSDYHKHRYDFYEEYDEYGDDNQTVGHIGKVRHA